MRHPSFETLSRSVDTGVSPKLQAHLRGCASCAATVARIEALRALARSLPAAAPAPGTERAVEQAVLAGALQIPQAPVRRWRQVAAATAAAAAVVALALAWSLSPGEPPLPATWTASPDARWTHLTRHPGGAAGMREERVQLEEGSLELQVEPLPPGMRFLVATDDAEVEVRGTAFRVEAEAGRLLGVAVTEGRVEVRHGGATPRLLGPGDRWAPPAPVPDPAADAGSPLVETPGPQAAPEVPGVAGRQQSHGGRAMRRPPAAAAPALAAPAPAPMPHPEPEPGPGEAAFARAWTLLREGEPHAAAAGFAAVDGPLAEDAAYWRVVALGRAGRAGEAAAAMEDFLRAHPHGSRAGEVQLMLGLQLLAAGDRHAAAVHLRAAAADPREAVAARAREALERAGLR